MANLIVDIPESHILRLILQDGTGQTLDTLDTPLEGHVDNILLTAVDKLLKRNSMDRFAFAAVTAGAGIDKTSSLYRIVKSFASAVSATNVESR